MAIASNFPAIKPSLSLDFANTKRLDSRVTFTRTTTATYYDGVTTAKAEENLFLYSQEFDNAAWATLRATVSANSTTAPDGTATADSLTQQTGQTTSGAVYTLANINYIASTYIFSVFAKPNGKNFIRLAMVDGGSVFRECYFNVNSGTVGTANNGAVGTITASANGYYRCSISYTFASASSMSARIFLADVDNSSTVVDSGGAYIWGAQLEQRSSVTAYTATTTQPITNYIPVLLTAASGVARFQHNPTTDESLGLLIEEARTNLLVRSEEFNTTWTTSNSSVSPNTNISPSGALTADTLVENTAANFHFVNQTVSGTTNTNNYTFSCFIKASTRTAARIAIIEGTTFSRQIRATADLSAGTVVGAALNSATLTAATIEPVGNNWYRVAVAGVLGGADTNIFCAVYVGQDTATFNYTGNGYSGIYIWGAQIEAGAFPTSYIATTAATVTRNADAASMTGSNFTSWYNAAEGAIYCESQTASFAQNQGIWAIGNPSLSFGSGNMMYAIYDSGVSGRILINSYTNGSPQVSNMGVVVSQTANTFSKSAYVYKVNDFAQTTNAASVFTDTSGTVPIGPTGLSIGGLSQGWSGAIAPVNGTIKKLAYYPLRVTNAQLQALTS